MTGSISPDKAVFSISVAAELTGVKPQALRSYEDKGLVTPARSDGGTRRYSTDDINRINDITSLLDDGLNLAGIAHVFALQSEAARLRDELRLARGRKSPRIEDHRSQ